MSDENPAPEGVEATTHTVVESPPPKLPVFRSGASVAAIVPTSFEETWRIAQLAIKSGLVPRDLMTAERACMAIMHGAEIGFPPMAALQRIAVINGRPCVWGDAIPAIAMRTGQLEKWEEGIRGEGDAMVAYCTVVRRVRFGTITRSAEFSVADAKQARLWSTEEIVKRKGRDGNMYEVKNDSPWFRFPKRMLQMRARVAFRDLFSDAMLGLHIAEEMVGANSDAEMRDVTPAAIEYIENPLAGEAVQPTPVTGEVLQDTPGGGERAGIPISSFSQKIIPAETTPAAESTPAIGAAAAEEQPRPARRKAKEKPQAEAAPTQPEPEKPAQESPAARPQPVFTGPWIRRRPEDYLVYIKTWCDWAVQEKVSGAALRQEWKSQSSIRNGLAEPLSPAQLADARDYVEAALKTLGG